MKIRTSHEGPPPPKAITDPRPPDEPRAPRGDPAESAPGSFASLVRGIGSEVSRGERIMSDAIRGGEKGRDYGPSELIALQAGVYRYSEAIDLVSKLVDRASSGVKTVITGQ